MACQPLADEISGGTSVLGCAQEFLGRHAGQQAAEARSHRIDEDDIGDIEQRVLVIHHSERRDRGGPCGVGKLDTPRPKETEMRPDRRGSGTTVEDEQYRP